MIHGHGEIGPQRGRILIHHRGQIEPLTDLGQERHAKLPPPVGNHEIDDFRSHLFCGTDEIALILAVFRVHDDDDFAPGDRLHGRING